VENWPYLKKINIELPYDLPISLLRICPKELKICGQVKTCTPMFVVALSTIVKG
jgi:hypothetical protein